MLALVALLLGVALKLGALDWSTGVSITRPDGTTFSLPNTFASGDHPFHIAKERSTLDALRGGWLPRWFMFQMAGFPAEFYPTGGDVIVVAVYALGAGRVPLEIAHKLVVIAVFMLPPIAYWALARRDKLPPGVAVAAAMLHLFLPGTWLAGGGDGLFNLGLWPDVLASYLALPFILWAADYFRHGDRKGLALAAGVATVAVYTNPRAIVAIATAFIALMAVAATERLRRLAPGSAPSIGRRAAVLGSRGALLTTLIVLLSAGLLLPLRAHQQLYQFAFYISFANLSNIWQIYREAIPVPVIALAGVGVVIAAWQGGFYSRVFALLLPLSYVIVAVVGVWLRGAGVFAQLEGPRLVSMLRPATLFLAALALHTLARALLNRLNRRHAARLAAVMTVAVVSIAVLTPLSPIPQSQRGLPAMATTGRPEFAALGQAIAAVEAARVPTDRLLILGSPIARHDPFWFPALTGLPAFHDQWLWYWRLPEYADQTQFKDARQSLDIGFLGRNGLTLVLIDTTRADLLAQAAALPYLTLLDAGLPGGYALYRVASPPGPSNGWVTFSAGTVDVLNVTPQRLVVIGQTPVPGVARIVINDFPAWQAEVNGRRVELTRSGDGYLLAPIPAGRVTLTLTYGTERVNWIARLLVAAGVAGLLAVCCLPAARHRRRFVRRVRRVWTRLPGSAR